MIKIATVQQMREIEASADAAGVSYAAMMDNAGEAVALRGLAFLETLSDNAPSRVLVLVGPGNNGGDGLVAGRVIAARSDAVVRFYLLRRRPHDDPVFAAARDAGLRMDHADDDPGFLLLSQLVASADLLIDALFGIGTQPPLRLDAARMIDAVQQALGKPSQVDPAIIFPRQVPEVRADARRIIAVDCPSGLNCDSGDIDMCALQADETVTFIAAKPGLLAFPGAHAVGDLIYASAGVPASLPNLQALSSRLVDAQAVRSILPPRPLDANKGTFGRVLVVGGSSNYIGAPGLSAQAAYRMGAGLVTIATIKQNCLILASTLAEPIWIPCPDLDGRLSLDALDQIRDAVPLCDAVVIGPGLGQHVQMPDFVIGVLSKAAELDRPTVIDADALNALASMTEWWKRVPRRSVLTPHPGEMARLSGLSIREIQADRLQIARSCAGAWNTTLLLKGAHTVIASPERASILPFKTTALATAGTGDILSGMISALLSQDLDPHDSAAAAGYIHGLAGEAAAGGSDRVVIASDVLSALRDVMRQIDTL
ncbi:MAG: NAD(P)H-hydrate dehydratase [Anaerolineae bacterium]|nr:NAD(P)H-hydrate dehydratase [Anaerolineae bacterium]NUQ02590.1 NAD(P)H-hydrate dehydratase [Anaerolineae bacterium]